MATVRKAIRGLKAEFDVAHRKGMAALQRRDYAALHEAIQQEAEILAEQRDAIAEHVHRSEDLMAALDKTLVPNQRRTKR